MTLSLFSNLVSSIFHINLFNLDVHSALKTSLLISKINFHVTENKLEKNGSEIEITYKIRLGFI